MALPRGFRPVRLAAKRGTDWGFGPGGNVITQITSTSAVFLGSALGLVAGQLMTVIRIRGSLLVYLSTAASINDGYLGAFGIGMASTDAIASGIAAVPSPLTDMDSETWLYHRFIQAKAVGPFASAAEGEDSINAVSAAQRIEVDSKAMRKMDDNVLLFAAIDVTEVGTATLNVAFDSRALFKTR